MKKPRRSWRSPSLLIPCSGAVLYTANFFFYFFLTLEMHKCKLSSAAGWNKSVPTQVLELPLPWSKFNWADSGPISCIITLCYTEVIIVYVSWKKLPLPLKPALLLFQGESNKWKKKEKEKMCSAQSTQLFGKVILKKTYIYNARTQSTHSSINLVMRTWRKSHRNDQKRCVLTTNTALNVLGGMVRSSTPMMTKHQFYN